MFGRHQVTAVVVAKCIIHISKRVLMLFVQSQIDIYLFMQFLNNACKIIE